MRSPMFGRRDVGRRAFVTVAIQGASSDWLSIFVPIGGSIGCAEPITRYDRSSGHREASPVPSGPVTARSATASLATTSAGSGA